jgi:uncharacterized membrane protein
MPTATIAFQQEMTSGPLPHPALLAEYGRVQADLVERIVKLAETEAEHRRGLEKLIVRSGVRRAAIGQFLGFLIGIGGLGAAVLCARYGYPTTAAIIAALDLVTLVSMFVVGGRREPKKLEPPAETVLANPK